MLGEQAIVPNFTSYPTPNPNPNPFPSYTDPYSQGFYGLQDPSAFEGVGAAASLSGAISQTIDSTAHEHVGVTMGETTNDVLATTLPESILLFQCEICNISCNTKHVLEKHKKGKKHIKSVKKLTDSSADAPKMVLPPVASEALVGELENKKHILLQNGATSEALIYCDICNVVCNNQEVFQNHVAGKKHSAKAIIQLASTNAVFNAPSDSISGPQKKHEIVQCEICKITCTSNELLKMHMAGKKHSKKLKDMERIQNLPLTSVTSQDTPPDPMVNQESNEGKTINLLEAKLVCELCGIWCDTNEVFKNHITGKKHLKRMKESQNTPTTEPMVNPESNEGKTVSLHEAKVACELCEISVDTNEMLKIHISGKKHKKNLEKSEKLIGPSPALTTEPAAIPVVIGPMQEEVEVGSSDGSNRKNKRAGIDEGVETKKQKVLQSGTALDALQTCNICNVVCNSRKVFISHLAGQKHAAMAVKQAETQARASGQES